MNIYTGGNGVAGMAHRPWAFHTITAAHAAAASSRKRRTNATQTLASVDRSFI